MVFPLEIYAEIISYITDNKSLFALLLTSRRLNQEAEKILYREPNPFLPSHWGRIRHHLSTCDRVAKHVRSIRVQVDVKSAREVCRVLNALNNLKSLTLRRLPPPLEPETLTTILSGVSFQLSKFATNFSIDRHLKSFLQSQPQITYLSLGEHRLQPEPEDLVFSRTDLPSLTSLLYADYTRFGRPPRIQTLFPEFFVTNLSIVVVGKLTTPLAAVRALRNHGPYLIESLSSIFPNIRFLDTAYDYFDIQKPSTLQKLKMWSYSHPIPNHAADILWQIYTKHQNLKCVELCHPDEKSGKVTICRIYQRFNPQSMVNESFSETCIENFLDHAMEWVDWKGF